MQTWTFCHVDGEKTKVRAINEQVARDAAMWLRWGPPRGMYGPTYQGLGLMLVEDELTPGDYAPARVLSASAPTDEAIDEALRMVAEHV